MGCQWSSVLIKQFICFPSSVFPPLFMKKDVFSISSYNPTRQSRIEALRRQLFAKYFPIILWPTFGFYERGKKSLLNSFTWLYHGPLLRINPHRLIENVNSTFFFLPFYHIKMILMQPLSAAMTLLVGEQSIWQLVLENVKATLVLMPKIACGVLFQGSTFLHQ